MRACAYLRVSTEDQDTQNQKDAIARYCEYQNISPDYFAEVASGKETTKREEFQLLLKQIKEGKYDKLIIWKLDRLTRSLKDLIHLIDTLNKHNCALISITESIDFSTPTGRMQVQLLGVFAEYERAIISERTKEGLKRARKNGRVPGKKPIPLDLTNIRQQIKEGKTVEQIALQQNLSRSQLYRRLQAGDQ